MGEVHCLSDLFFFCIFFFCLPCFLHVLEMRGDFPGGFKLWSVLRRRLIHPEVVVSRYLGNEMYFVLLCQYIVDATKRMNDTCIDARHAMHQLMIGVLGSSTSKGNE